MYRITILFPSKFLEEHADELGVVEHDRKLQIPAFVWSFVFRRSYNATADETLSPGGFYQRLTPLLAEYLRDLVEVAVPDTVDAVFDRFRDVMVVDGTVLRLR
ncbi:transposase (ISH8) [Natronorubrum bangense JCM 10635]|uniref:Transposase (ISH8) n=1 Tax=Natronorubrum bangense JCM 10635 TaxID=1227500 RepID=L9VZK8_9EURY|nr:transposase (ISH8) [Natronorubrum bangense JCM 10635]